jgi:GT2 family glycosyltransferase/glycosyltransferase involved in cell wall biosynthesis
VAVLGQPDEAWLGTLLAQLPPDIELIVLHSSAAIAGSVDAGQAQVRVLANAPLPPFALRRLLDAATSVAHDFDVVSAADAGVDALNPLPEDQGFDGDAFAIDAKLWLLGGRTIRPCGDAVGALAWLAPTCATRLGLGRSLCCGVLDSLYVAAAGTAPRGPATPSARHLAAPQASLSTLRVAIAGAGSLPVALPGLDRGGVVLHVLHGWGGGIEKFALDLADGDDERWHLALFARGEWARRTCAESLELALLHEGRAWPLSRSDLAAPISTCVHGSGEWRAVFADARRRFGIGGIIVSSLIGHSLDALATGLPTEFICHDYFPLWPMLHADFDQLAADASELARTLASAQPPEFPFAERDPGFWRALRSGFLARMEGDDICLAAPTAGVRRNWLRLAPELAARRFEVIGHGLRPFGAVPLPPPPARPRLRIVVPGRINGGKGERLLRALLDTNLRDHAELFLIGCGRSGLGFLGERDVHLVFDYERNELPALLARIAPDAALLPATVSESFSYTLSEMNALAIPVIATRLGALDERIEHLENGILVAPEAHAIAALVADLYADPGALAAVRERLAVAPAAAGVAEMSAAHRALVPTRTAAALWHDDADPHAATSSARLLAAVRERDALRAEVADKDDELLRRTGWARTLDRERARAAALAESRKQDCAHLAQEREALLARATECAHALDEREARIERLAAELDATHQRHAEAQHDWVDAAARFKAEIARLEAERAELLGSHSWRLTRPLRFTRRQLGNARVQIAYFARRAIGLPPRVMRSLRVRGLKGTIERARGGEAPAMLALPAPELLSEVTAPDSMAIELPRAASPRASIVIPVYNKWRYTEACLRSLAKEIQRSGFEVIVVDDGSSDETWDRLQQIEGITAHRNAENLGFVGSCNAGAALATGDYLVFLNNDTQVAPNWLDTLLDTFDQHPRVGLVGSKLVYPDGRLQEAGGIVFSDGSGWNYGRFGDPRDPAHNYVREVDYCSGAAIAIPRELFAQRGGFDARYAPAYYEDTDLAFQVREAGLRVLYQPASVVFHFEGVTAGTDTTSGTKKYQVINQQKFLERWTAVLPMQPAPGTPIERAREHRVRQRVLIVDATTPHPDEDSGSVRMVNLMRVLGSLGHKVSFFAENRSFDGRYTEALQQLGVEVLYHPWMPDPTRWLREQGAAFDAVLISRHYIAAPLVDAVRRHAPKARLVFDTVDLHYLREEREAALADRDDLRRQAATTKLAELRLIRQSDVTLVVSPIEQELLQREIPGARIEVLSNVHEVVGRRAGFHERKDLFFVGGFQHPPNIDAMLWFVHAVWPQIAGALPDARFHIVGSKMPDAIKALASERVVVHGFLPSLDAMLDGCRLSVAPLRYGAGVKGKVNQSMAHGQPVVATTVAAEGMYLKHGTDVLVADDADAFAREVIRLYTDEPLWTRLADGGLANIANHFSFAAAAQALRRVLG